jgi:hypothetical protein
MGGDSIINAMLLFDVSVFLFIIVGLHILKWKYPNFLFFCRGAILFLPICEQPIQPNKKNSKDK